jgi:prevent-host-death family protein
MEPFDEILPVTKIKKDLLKLIKRMEEEGMTIAITRKGVSTGIMMPYSRYESLLETIEILSDQEALEPLRQSGEDFRNGRVFTHEAVWEDP